MLFTTVLSHLHSSSLRWESNHKMMKSLYSFVFETNLSVISLTFFSFLCFDAFKFNAKLDG